MKSSHEACCKPRWYRDFHLVIEISYQYIYTHFGYVYTF